jgi:hypothetical protein
MPPWLGWTEADVAAAVTLVGHCLGVAATGRPYVLKFRSWNALFARTICGCFPGVPWAFVIRDPVEVAVSVLETPPTWLRTYDAGDVNPFASVDGWAGVPAGCREVYVARMLAAFVAAVAALSPDHGLVVPYTVLPDAAWGPVAGHFGLRATDAALVELRRRATVYSKDPAGTVPFVPDAAGKRARSTPELRKAIETYAAPALAALRAKHRVLRP